MINSRFEVQRSGSIWLAILIAGCGWCAALDIPFLGGRVNDLAGLLSAQTVSELEGQLETLEQDTGSQIAVLTVPSLEDEALSDFTLRVAETWKLGRGKFDDGALLFISRDDRTMRLEVGYGLEPVLTDAMSKRILDEVMAPRFRSGDFDGGISAAVGAIDGLIRGDGTLPPPANDQRVLPAREGRRNPILFFAFLIPITLFSRQALAARGCLAWFLYLFLMPFWLFFPLALLGKPLGYIPICLWAVGFPILWAIRGRGPGGPGGPPGGSGSRWGPIVFPTGGWSSSGGGFGGGGFGGGGFSGGGGSFGGGGASGSW